MVFAACVSHGTIQLSLKPPFRAASEVYSKGAETGMGTDPEPAQTASIVFDRSFLAAAVVETLQVVEIMFTVCVVLRGDVEDDEIEHCHEGESLVEFREGKENP